jgi:hypothetical protein
MTIRQPLEPTATPVYSYRHSFNDVTGVIRNYTPRTPKRFWDDAVQEFTRNAVTELEPVTESDAAAYLSYIAQLAIWTVNIACHPLRREIVFDQGNIDAFIRDHETRRTPKSLNSLQFRLYRVARELGGNVPPAFSKSRRPSRDVFGPYTSREMIRFRNQAASRSTPARRHNLKVVLALAAGCALSADEIMSLPASAIRIHTDAVRVDVQGPRARTVVCLARWEDDLREAAESELIDYYVFVKDERATYAYHYLNRYVERAVNTGQAFNIERLRSSWIVIHLNAGTPVFALARALGLKSISTFKRFEGFVDHVLDDENHTAAFRQVRA